MYIHSYLHEWISWTSNEFLNVKLQKSGSWQISEIRWNQLIFRWLIDLWSLPEIFPKLYWLLHQFHRDQKFWGWNWFFKIWIFPKGDVNWAFNMLIGEDNDTYICKYFCHWSLISKVQFFNILNFTCIFRNFPLAIFPSISCEFNLGPLYKHYATCLKS